MKKLKLLSFIFACLLLVSCGSRGGKLLKTVPDSATEISLSDELITVDGAEISENKNGAVYLSNDIVYYKDGTDFTYGEGMPADMHTESEAMSHSVINITHAGEYTISGKLSHGQIAVDLGEDAEDDPSAVVTLYLNGTDIFCSVAPAIIFYNVYECGDSDEDTARADVDTSDAGANIVIADNSENIVNGAYVAKIYKSVELDDTKTEVIDSKKLHKYDAAINSKMSMNIFGEELGNGILTVNAENEGISTDLHLTVCGGNININSGNDGINTNEDYVSVMKVKSGNINIAVNGKTGEGDGIDSNGWIIIEDGIINAYACSNSMDSGLDADKGVYIRGGQVNFTGNMLDRFESDMNSVTLMFSEKQPGKKTYTLKNVKTNNEIAITPDNSFTQLVLTNNGLTEGEYTLTCDGEPLRGAEFEININMGMPQPDGKDNDRKRLPQPDGEIPDDFPKDGNFKPGEMPKPPEGFNEGEVSPPHGMPNQPVIDDSMVSDIFNIKKGSNTFWIAK